MRKRQRERERDQRVREIRRRENGTCKEDKGEEQRVQRELVGESDRECVSVCVWRGEAERKTERQGESHRKDRIQTCEEDQGEE